jgi:hypothetical protein
MKPTASSIKKATPPWSHRNRGPLGQAPFLIACASLVLSAASLQVQGDQIELQNGDRYVGQVLSLDTKTVVLQSAVLGTVRVPRNKVAVITLGTAPATNSPALPLPANAQLSTPAVPAATAGTNSSPELRGLGTNTNLIQQVQNQFLSGAGTEANAKFNELLGGLMNGKLNVDDIRAQAKTAADQLRALQKDSGEDTGFATSAYLAILDHFLKETAPSGSGTNAPARSPGPTPLPAEKEE